MKTAMQELIDEILSKQEIWFDEDGNILQEPIIQYVNSFKSSVDLSEYVNKAVEKEKEQQTPIELPSDKEIYELMDNLPFSKHIGDELFNNGQRKGFELGIKYIRHQILNQNKTNKI